MTRQWWKVNSVARGKDLGALKLSLPFFPNEAPVFEAGFWREHSRGISRWGHIGATAVIGLAEEQGPEAGHLLVNLILGEAAS